MKNNVNISINQSLVHFLKGAEVDVTVNSVKDYKLNGDASLGISIEPGENEIKMSFKYLGATCGFAVARFAVNGNDTAEIVYNPPEILAMGGSISITIKQEEPAFVPPVQEEPVIETVSKTENVEKAEEMNQQPVQNTEIAQPEITTSPQVPLNAIQDTTNSQQQPLVREVEKDIPKPPQEKKPVVQENSRPAVSQPVHNVPKQPNPVQYNYSDNQVQNNRKKSSSAVVIILLAAVIGVLMLVIVGIVFGNSSTDVGNPPDVIDEVIPIEEEDPFVLNEEVVNNLVAPYTQSTEYAVYVKNLTNGKTYGYNEHTRYPSSALTYMSIMGALGNYIDTYNYDLDYEGIWFYYMPNGREMPDSKYYDGNYRTIREYVEAVCTYGDNNCANHLVDWLGDGDQYLGFNYINRWLSNQGYTNTNVNRKIVIDPTKIDHSAAPNMTTAHDICNIFNDVLFNDKLGNAEYMKNICQYRDQTDYYGLQKKYRNYYTVANHNVANSQSSNEVAYISDGYTELVIAIISYSEDKSDEDKYRRMGIEAIADYIVENQF